MWVLVDVCVCVHVCLFESAELAKWTALFLSLSLSLSLFGSNADGWQQFLRQQIQLKALKIPFPYTGERERGLVESERKSESIRMQIIMEIIMGLMQETIFTLFSSSFSTPLRALLLALIYCVFVLVLILLCFNAFS